VGLGALASYAISLSLLKEIYNPKLTFTKPSYDALKIVTPAQPVQQENLAMNPLLADLVNSLKTPLGKTLALTYPFELFQSIRTVETGGHKNPNYAVGLSGEVGAYQITEAYLHDALEHCPNLKKLNKTVHDPYYAEAVMISYWDRYASSGDYETLCKLHNGGPQGPYKSSNVYWEKVKHELEKRTGIRY
jgi:hypothetical protein